MRNIRYQFLTLVLTSLLLGGCGTQVSRVDTKESLDLSGAWNDTDSRLVSEEIITDMLQRSWYQTHSQHHKSVPVVIVGEIRNLSHEHINLNTFIADIERAMINSGKIDFVASSQERSEIRDERKDQDLHSTESSRKEMGQERGADYMLQGSINTIIDMEGTTQLRYYQVDLTLISLKDNRKVWLGQKKIKKVVKNSKLRF